MEGREIKEKGVNVLTRAREDEVLRRGSLFRSERGMRSVRAQLTLQGSYVLHRDPADLHFTLPDLYFSAPAFRIRRW
jgi:hypothetical protein